LTTKLKVQIQIILFHAMAAVRAIFMAKIHLQNYNHHINTTKTKRI